MSQSRWLSPAALLLDIDNTVYSYAPCHSAGLSHAFEHSENLSLWQTEQEFLKAYDAARELVKSRLRNQAAAHSRTLYFKEMIEQRLGYTEFHFIGRIEQAYWDGYASQLTPAPGCGEVLRKAAADGIRLAWISNFTTERQIWKLRLLGLDNLRSTLVTSEESGADKPDPSIIDLAQARLGIRDRRLWIIGDEPADVNAAKARGLPVLLLGGSEESDGGASPWRRSVRDWSEIGEVLHHARN